MLAAALAPTSSCGPQFRNVREYAPPETAEGLRCASRCSGDQNECRSICDDRFEDCQHAARATADRRYGMLYDQYVWDRRTWEAQYAQQRWRKDEIDRHRAQVRHDLDNADRGCDRGNAAACSQEQNLKRELERLPELWIPPAPVPPDRDSLVRDYARECRSDCGCDDRHRSCFEGCGGRVTDRSVCVEGCE